MFDSETSCKPGISWFQWCPVDIVLWVLVLLVASVACWKVCRSNRARSGIPESRRSNRKYYRLTLPYPSELPSLEKGEYDSEHKGDGRRAFADPYHVVNKLDDSLIANDPFFLLPSVPKPVLDKEATKRHSGFGLGIRLEQPSPISCLSEGVIAKSLAQSDPRY